MNDIRNSLWQETVAQVPASQPCCVTPEATTREVFALLRQHSHSGVLVCDDGILEGIFTERDALRMIAHRESLDVPIAHVMTSPTITLHPQSTIAEALKKMCAGGMRRLPIVDDEGRPLAVIDMPALVHYLDEYFPSLVYNLPPKQMECTPERHGA